MLLKRSVANLVHLVEAALERDEVTRLLVFEVKMFLELLERVSDLIEVFLVEEEVVVMLTELRDDRVDREKHSFFLKVLR